MNSRHDHLRRFRLWAVVCTVCAAPSFYGAVGAGHSLAAMVCGVLAFAVGMTVVSGHPVFLRFKARPHVRRTLYIGYVTRVVISIMLPVGFFLDMFPGMVSIGLVDVTGLDIKGFVGTFLITVIQGTLLNMLLSIYMAVVYALCKLFGKRVYKPGLCQSCGYDLRATPQRCPECGTAPLPAEPFILTQA